MPRSNRRRVKNPGAVVLKRMIKSMQKLQNNDGAIKGEVKIKSAADFTSLKTLASKFKNECNIAHAKTLSALVPEIESALTAAMNSKSYNWQYGDGDIVQTGKLRDSVNVVSTEDSIIVSYSATNEKDGFDYAAIVYYGGMIHPYGNPSIKVMMPARPWIKDVLIGGSTRGIDKFPLTARYLHYFEKFLKQLLPKGSLK